MDMLQVKFIVASMLASATPFLLKLLKKLVQHQLCHGRYSFKSELISKPFMISYFQWTDSLLGVSALHGVV